LYLYAYSIFSISMSTPYLESLCVLYVYYLYVYYMFSISRRIYDLYLYVYSMFSISMSTLC